MSDTLAEIGQLRHALAQSSKLAEDRLRQMKSDRAACIEARRRCANLADALRWVLVDERMPASGQTVLACYKNRLGNWRRIRACWVAAKTEESNVDSEIGEYDDDSDTYYDPEGWYETIDNWDDCTAAAVHQGEITHWMPLPDPPQGAE